MPLQIVTPIRAKFIAGVRAKYLAKYGAPCVISDNRILVAALFYKFIRADDPDIQMLLGDLAEQQVLSQPKHGE